MSSKKKIIITASVILLIALVLVSVLCGMFCSRKIDSVVGMTGIEKVELLKYGAVVKELSPNDIGEISNMLKKSKYAPRYFECKCVSEYEIKISYVDKSILLGEYKILTFDNKEQVIDKKLCKYDIKEIFNSFA